MLSIDMERLEGLKRGAGTDDDKTRVLMLGLQGAGKTSLLQRISGTDRALLDMGNQKFKVRSLQTPVVHLTVWDVGEEKFIDPYWSEYHYERTTALCFVVNANDPSKIAEARKELFKLGAVEKLRKMPVLILATHGDKEGALSTVKVSEALELHEFKNHPYKVFQTSGQPTDDMQAALEWLVRWSPGGFYSGEPLSEAEAKRRSGMVEATSSSPRPGGKKAPAGSSLGVAVPVSPEPGAGGGCCVIA